MDTAGCAIWQGWQYLVGVEECCHPWSSRGGVLYLHPALRPRCFAYLRPRGHGSELVLSEVRPPGLGVKLVLG